MVTLPLPSTQSVQCFGHKKTVVAVIHYKHGRGGVDYDQWLPDRACSVEDPLLQGLQADPPPQS
ncbi:40S ribosomal protein S16 [Acorus gramineus]|uniref:40S ribosomal protein S16 n=1 Tax=Acorus gramineus TaxID=55184 RepID=A0AAV9BPS8_ACOGR|nr:40S ribosomal protein S16 [Acorus gramineus]